MTQYIKAPFNFVPLNDKVFFPDWAEQISHDIPFEDGESGTIELELTAMTPIFVRNGHNREHAESFPKIETYTSFSKDADNNYFIPATSVKGMIRNVLEIISFGKINLSGEYTQKEIKDKNLRHYIPKNHLSISPDLPDCLFGSISENKEVDSTKGRIQFGHAFCINPDKVQILQQKKITLAGPKPSYYPIYLQQNEDKRIKGKVLRNYQTYEENSILNGWKRYPIHSHFLLPPDSIYKTINEEKKQASMFVAIDKAIFSEKVKFHNLKKAEIGALISALTFHGTDNCYHSLGSAKAYGYGKMKLTSIKFVGKHTMTDYLIGFEDSFKKDKLDQFENFKLKESDVLKELIVMAQEQSNQGDSALEYMSLDKKEFYLAKRDKEFLNKYSQLNNIKLISEIGGSEFINSDAKKKQILFDEEESIKIALNFQRLEIERLQKEAEEKQEEAQRLEDIRLKLEAEEKARTERLAQKVEEGLSFLESSRDFDGAKRRTDDWMKKAKVEIIPEIQQQYLLDAIIRFYNDQKPKDKKKWEEPFDNNHIWKKITSWVGNDIANNWYRQIIN